MPASTARWPWIAPIVIYAVSALEMIIMISPAAAYFYSVYTPLFHGLEQSAATAWLPQFFLPHLAATRVPFFRWLTLSGAALALLGLLGFFFCAVQLYYGKFVKKKLVSGGLYGRVRHPQYLCLAIAGAGFLLLWPRFFILASFLVMLGLYYILARHEEELIRQRYGSATDDYLASVPMFNPFRGRRKAPGARPVPRTRALLAWLAVSAVTLALAFLLRSVGVNQLYTLRTSQPDVTTLALNARTNDEIAALTRSVLATPTAQALMARDPGTSLFIQISGGSSQLKHLLIDLGMRENIVSAIPSGSKSAYAVVSRVTARDPAVSGRPDPLAFGTDIEPLFYVQVADGRDPVVYELLPEQFHPGFSRIRF
ncbi:MAG: isoprenylcysteine carboxylmethyltransferase family protein [Gammaproteobacteria bacterium]|nr:isoprenylcysteine carboxylmethyltransferase family protein [Gammaproteobacteria bacterium]